MADLISSRSLASYVAPRKFYISFTRDEVGMKRTEGNTALKEFIVVQMKVSLEFLLISDERDFAE